MSAAVLQVNVTHEDSQITQAVSLGMSREKESRLRHTFVDGRFRVIDSRTASSRTISIEYEIIRTYLFSYLFF
jgi:hypothetical protein